MTFQRPRCIRPHWIKRPAVLQCNNFYLSIVYRRVELQAAYIKQPYITDDMEEPTNEILKNLHLEADLNPVIHELTSWLTDTRKGIKKLISGVFPEKWREMIHSAELSETQHTKNLKDIESGTLIYSPATKRLSSTLAEEFKSQETANMLHIANQAAQFLNSIEDSEIDDEPLDRDFFNRWRREAEIIEDEEMQQIWARLLVEEVKSSKSISRRTLERVKTMTGEEARAFSQLLRSHISGNILAICKGNNALKIPVNGGVSPEMLSALADNGLIENLYSDHLRLTYNCEKESDWLILPVTKKVGITFETRGQFQINVIKLTASGHELVKLALPDITDSDVKNMISVMEQSNEGHKFSTFTSKGDPVFNDLIHRKIMRHEIINNELVARFI